MRRAALIVLVLALAGLAWVVGSAILAGYDLPPEHGEVIATWEGSTVHYQNSFVGSRRGTYGLEFQCVELANRYLVTRGHRNLTRTGHALSYYTGARAKGLRPYPNGGTEAPRVGDLIVFRHATIKEGHVGIITAVNTTSVTVLQQNATQKIYGGILVRPMPWLRLPYHRSGGHHIVGGSGPLTPLGWSRAQP